MMNDISGPVALPAPNEKDDIQKTQTGASIRQVDGSIDEQNFGNPRDGHQLSRSPGYRIPATEEVTYAAPISSSVTLTEDTDGIFCHSAASFSALVLSLK
jgi:hypothetical protein